MTISKKLEAKIVSFCESNPISIDFDYRDELEKEQIVKILETEDGLNILEDEICENSLDYIFETEDYFLKETVFDEFQEELIEEFSSEYPEESEDWIETEVKDYLLDNFRDYLYTSMNMKQLLNNTGNITCLIPVYSNYDCCNSFDNPKEKESYLGDVYRRIKTGVKRKDFENEFYNGAYGGSLFCFAFQTDLENLIELKKQIKTAKKIIIPEGTQFGFFSSFQGAGSVFEKTTYKKLTMLINESEYDSVDIIADCEQSYSMNDVYGCSDFLTEQNIQFPLA